MTPASDSRDRIAVLDGLRALAILLVLALHLTNDIAMAAGRPFSLFGSTPLLYFLMNGWTGVQLFFVLSGFLITGQLLDPRIGDPARRGALIKGYFLRRFCRIAPAYYLILIVACALRLHPAFNPEATAAAGQEIGRYLWHFLFLQDYFHPAEPVRLEIIGFWSLATEAKFYLIAPFIVMGLWRLAPRGRYLALAAAMAALLAMRIAVFLYVSPADDTEFFYRIRTPFHMALDGLLAGMMASLLWHDDRARQVLCARKTANALFWGGTAAFLLLTALVRPHYGLTPPNISLFTGVFYFTLVAGAFSAMLLGLMGGCAGHGAFELRPLRFIALVSYSLFLIHRFFTAPVVVPAVLKMAEAAGNPDDLGLIWLAGFALFLLVTLPVAAVIYHIVEKPFIEEARRAAARMQAD